MGYAASGKFPDIQYITIPRPNATFRKIGPTVPGKIERVKEGTADPGPSLL
jgi:hypothetical protein